MLVIFCHTMTVKEIVWLRDMPVCITASIMELLLQYHIHTTLLTAIYWLCTNVWYTTLYARFPLAYDSLRTWLLAIRNWSWNSDIISLKCHVWLQCDAGWYVLVRADALWSRLVNLWRHYVSRSSLPLRHNEIRSDRIGSRCDKIITMRVLDLKRSGKCRYF